MGVIQRQGIKQTIAFFLGAVIGGINNIILFPKVFEPDQIGLIRLFQDVAVLIAPFLLLGSSGLTIRYFPKFKNEKNGHNGYLIFLLSIVSVGIFLYLLIFLGFKEQIIDYYRERSPLVSQFYFFMIPVTIGYGLTALFNQYSSNFLRLTVPAIISQFIKPVMAIISLAYLWHWMTFPQVISFFSFWYVISLLLLVLYVRYLGELHTNTPRAFLNKPLLIEMSGYALFGILSSAGSNFIFKLDTVMLASMTDLKQTGIYTIAAFIASVIMIPTNSLISISAPIISEAWHDNDFIEIRNIYKKASLNLAIIGAWFILNISASINDLFDFMPNGDIYRVGIPIIFILLASHIFNMITSVNTEIIGYSTYYKINFYSLMITGLINIGLNYLLIPHFQLLGPAIATTISLFFFNLFKLVFIYQKFKIHPFGKSTLKVLYATFITLAFVFIPISTGYPLINIALKSTIITLVFVLLTIKMNASPEFTQLVLNFFKKFSRK